MTKRIGRIAAAVFLAGSLLTAAVSCQPAGGELETLTDPTGGGVTETAADGSTSRSPDSEGVSGEETASGQESTAPDFTVLDAEGGEVNLSDFFGTPIVLNFWASWCPPCKAELPDFEAACKKYEGKVTFLMVNLTDGQRETVEIAKSYVTEQGYTFPVYFDTAYVAAYAYGISSIPQTYFISAEGEIVARATGMISANQLEQGIGMIYTAD